jgi:hypothetical protein
VSIGWVSSLSASLTVNDGSLHLGLVLLLGTCVERRRLLPIPLRGGKWHVQAPRKVSAEVSNLSKDEICSNYSLSICPRFLQPFTALPEGQAPKALRSRISSSGTSRGPAIDVFNIRGGRCQIYCQHPLGGTPSVSSTSVVAAAGPADSTLQGARHRRLQLRWWPLPDLAANTPGGPPSTSSTLVVDTVRLATSTPQGARHRCL